MNNKNEINVLFKEKLPIVKIEIEILCTNFFFKNIDKPINMIELISPENYKNYRELKTDLTNDICAELDNIFNDDKLKINLVSTKEKIEEEVNNKIIIGIKEILTNTEIDENNFILPPLKTEISFFEDIENIKRNFRKQMEDAMPSYWFTNYFQTTTDEAGKVINILFDGVDEKDEEEKTKFNNFHGLIDLINQKKVSTREKILKETDAMVNSVIGENNKSIDEKSEIKEQTKQERENNIKKYEQEIKNITEKIKEIEEYKDNFNK